MTFIPSAVKRTIMFGPPSLPQRPAMPTALYPGTQKIVLDSAGARGLEAVWAIYEKSRSVPHFTLDLEGKVVYQHISLDGSAPIDESSRQAPHKRGRSIWVNIAKASSERMTDEESVWVGKALRDIADFSGVRTDQYTDFPGPVNSRDRGVQLTPNAWYQFSGIASAAAIPHVSRYGPGYINIVKVAEGLEAKAPKQPEPKPEPEEENDWPQFRGRSVSTGSKGKMVEHLQSILGLEVTGEYDEDLEIIVLALKNELGLEPVDAVIDASVWNAFGEFWNTEEEDNE